MRRSFILLVVLGACGFRSPPGIGGASDASPMYDASPPYCDPSDPHLVACYQFEGDTKDSSANHLDATMVNVTFPTGRVGQAMQFGINSAADVPDSTAFDLAALTIEAWIWPAVLPVGTGREGILDMNNQYGFFFYAGGDPRCTASVVTPSSSVRLTTDRWTHVACTYDGTAATVYLDGVAVAHATGGGALNTGGNTGISLAADNPPGSGSRLIGLIDQVRLMNVARTAEQICADAGQSSCP